MEWEKGNTDGLFEEIIYSWGGWEYAQYKMRSCSCYWGMPTKKSMCFTIKPELPWQCLMQVTPAEQIGKRCNYCKQCKHKTFWVWLINKKHFCLQKHFMWGWIQFGHLLTLSDVPSPKGPCSYGSGRCIFMAMLNNSFISHLQSFFKHNGVGNWSPKDVTGESLLWAGQVAN